MSGSSQLLGVYLELAELYDQQGQSAMRDRFLLLAADAALAEGQPDEADRLRDRFLQNNPHHLIKPYSSFAHALTAPEVSSYLNSLKKNYPPEVAHDLLQTLQNRSRPKPQDRTPTTPLRGDANEQTANLGNSPPAFPDHNEEHTSDLGNTAPLPAWIPGTQLHLGKHDSAHDEPPRTAPFQSKFGGPPEAEDDIPQTLPPQRGPRGRREEEEIPQTLPPQKKPRSPLPPRPQQAQSSGGSWRGTIPAQDSKSQRPPSSPGGRPSPLYGASQTRPEQEPERPQSNVFVLVLFVLVMLAGLALIGYTFIKPFLK
jgi:hypothetical protein